MKKNLFFTLIALVTLQPLAAMEDWASQKNEQKIQKELGDALIEAVQADAKHNDNTDKIFALLCQGADINYEDQWDRTALCYAKRGQTCSLLLLNGARLIPEKPETDGHPRNPIHYLNSSEQLSTLLCRGVYVPNEQTIKNSKQIIIAMLRVLKRNRVPSDIRKIILALDPQHHIGNVMIARKLMGLPIPSQFIDATEKALYNSTIRQLKQIIKNRPFIQHKLNDERFKAIEQEVRKHIRNRLDKERLFSNGVAEPESFCTIL